MSHFSVADWIMLALLLWAGWEGLRAGLVKTLGQLLAFLLAWKMASWLWPYMEPLLFGAGNTKAWLRPLGLTFCFILIYGIAGFLILVIHQVVNLFFLGWMNRAMGLMAGLLLGGAFLFFVVWVSQSTQTSMDWMQDSRIWSSMEDQHWVFEWFSGRLGTRS